MYTNQKKEKNIMRQLFIFFLFFFLLIITKEVKAETILSQPFYDNSVYTHHLIGFDYSFYVTGGSGYTATSSQLAFFFDGGFPYADVNIDVYNPDQSIVYYSGLARIYKYDNTASCDFPAVGGSCFANIDFTSTTVNLVPDGSNHSLYYHIWFQTVPQDDQFRVRGSVSTSLPYFILNGTNTPTPPSNYNYFDQFENSLSIDFPPSESYLYYNIQYATNFPFRYSYYISSSTLKTNSFFQLEGCNNATYTDCTFISSSSISILDLQNSGKFINTDITPASTTTFYIASLKSGVYDLYDLNFKVAGTSDITKPGPADINLIATSSASCNSWYCNLFQGLIVPSQQALDKYNYSSSNSIGYLLSTKIPFAYFPIIRDKFTEISIASTSFALGFVYTNPFNSQTTTLTLFNSEATVTKNILDGLRPWMGSIIYVLTMFAMYLTLKNVKL